MNTTCINRGDCRWIYLNSDNEDDNNIGKCYNASVIECKDIFQRSQCESGLNIDRLDCGMYGTTCKTKCEILTTTTCTSDDRGNDCFLIKNINGENECKNIVCLYLYLHLYFLLYIIIIIIIIIKLFFTLYYYYYYYYNY
jgi:hypothetical protein